MDTDMATAEATYRQATIEDAEAIAGVINRIVQEPDPVGLEGPTTAEGVRTWLKRQSGQGGIFLCLVEDRVAGFGALDFNTQEPDTRTLGVWVLPEYRRRELGTAVAEYALGFARDKGYRRLRGRLPENNEVALSFLSSIGALVPIYNPDMRFELPL
jgi:GNAT superfamily N-acetyltransferase